MEKEIWAIGDLKKVKEHCFTNCKEAMIGCIEVENIPCIPCREKKCKYVKKEYKNYGKIDDGSIVHLRILK